MHTIVVTARTAALMQMLEAMDRESTGDFIIVDSVPESPDASRITQMIEEDARRVLTDYHAIAMRTLSIEQCPCEYDYGDWTVHNWERPHRKQKPTIKQPKARQSFRQSMRSVNRNR